MLRRSQPRRERPGRRGPARGGGERSARFAPTRGRAHHGRQQPPSGTAPARRGSLAQLEDRSLRAQLAGHDLQAAPLPRDGHDAHLEEGRLRSDKLRYVLIRLRYVLITTGTADTAGLGRPHLRRRAVYRQVHCQGRERRLVRVCPRGLALPRRLGRPLPRATAPAGARGVSVQ